MLHSAVELVGVLERSRMCARCWEIFLSIPAVRRADDGRQNNQMHDVYTKLDHDLGIRHVEKRWLQLLLSAAHHDERRFMKGHWFACDGGVGRHVPLLLLMRCRPPRSRYERLCWWERYLLNLIMIIPKTKMCPTLAFYMLVPNCLSLDSIPGFIFLVVEFETHPQ